jgi:hypothetical protein
LYGIPKHTLPTCITRGNKYSTKRVQKLIHLSPFYARQLFIQESSKESYEMVKEWFLL